MKNYLVNMNIDEERAFVLSRYDKKLGVIQSDHNILSCNFSVQYKKLFKNQRSEKFNLKCEESRKRFRDDLKMTDDFSVINSSGRNPKAQAKMFVKTLNRKLYKSFKKVRPKTKTSFDQLDPRVKQLLSEKHT